MQTPPHRQPHAAPDLLRGLFAAALRAVDPAHCLPPLLHEVFPSPPAGRTVVVGAGKAAAAMAHALETDWERRWPGFAQRLSGLVVTRYGHVVPCRHIEVSEAAHPVPDAAGQAGAQRMLAVLRGLTSDDLVIALLSGGGSALLTLPLPGLTLADKQEVTRALLACGATIAQINCVRKHLSALKGGRLALAAQPARVVTFALSDVPGDVPALIASGPTLADESTCADALALLERYRIAVPATVRAVLESGAGETPRPEDARFAGHTFHLIARAQTALEAAARAARAAGLAPFILGADIEGEARAVAHAQAGQALACARGAGPVPAPCVLLSGGETTVTLAAGAQEVGRGGRNTEYLLALALALEGAPGIHAVACDTDGIDGSEDNAGALIGPDTLARARAAGLDARAFLDRHDAYGFFAALGDLVCTGPTRTNVNDFRAILVT